MGKLAFIISLFSHLFSFSQSVEVTLLDNCSSIESLIPSDWKILSVTKGDLNDDRVNDIVFVIEKTDKTNIIQNEVGLGRDSINLNPRILGIYFTNTKGELIKQLQSNNFIIIQDSPIMDEPFEGFKILENGVLEIGFKFWFSAGSWTMSNHTYSFKYQNNKFELINYEGNERHRGTGDETDYSINFLTKKLTKTKTIIDDNNLRTISNENKDFKIKELKSILSLGKPFDWEFYGIYL